MRTKSNDDMANALKLLESAARHKREELRAAVSGKYDNLRDLLREREHGFLRALAGTKDQAVDSATRLEEAGRRQVLAAGREIERTVCGHPWLALAGTAVISLVLGCVVSRGTRG
jgi:ElaB/YqjD/DUF883 family membrane-anchored ribosome-binding protein